MIGYLYVGLPSAVNDASWLLKTCSVRLGGAVVGWALVPLLDVCQTLPEGVWAAGVRNTAVPRAGTAGAL